MIYLKTIPIIGATVGELRYNDFSCKTLELPWRMNASDISCIPAGIYPVHKHATKNVLVISEVPGRFGIQIHAGNYTSELQGCILPGRDWHDLDHDGVTDVASSKDALRALMLAIPERTYIVIDRS